MRWIVRGAELVERIALAHLGVRHDVADVVAHLTTAGLMFKTGRNAVINGFQ